MKKIEVVAAVIIKNDKVLCMQRNINKHEYISYKFEFPGGKVEAGELGSEALMREIFEEMNAEIKISEDDYFMTVDHQYPDFNLIMHAYICKVDDFIFKLNEHIDFKWSYKEAIWSLDWAEADKPIIDKMIFEGLI